MSKKKPVEDNTEGLKVYLPVELAKYIRDEAVNNHRTITGQIIHMMEIARDCISIETSK